LTKSDKPFSFPKWLNQGTKEITTTTGLSTKSLNFLGLWQETSEAGSVDDKRKLHHELLLMVARIAMTMDGIYKQTKEVIQLAGGKMHIHTNKS